MVMFKKIDSLEEQLNMYQRVTQKLDENLERLDEDLKHLEQKQHSEPLSARSDTVNDLLTEINTQLNKQQHKYESVLGKLSDKLATISTDLYLTRAWKLIKSDDSLFTHLLCRTTKDTNHIAYLHKNFISALNFLPRMEQLFDLLVELRRQASNSDLDLNWYLAFIDVNQKTDANFIEKIKDHRVQILDLFTDTWHTIFAAQRICWNNTCINFDKEPQTPQYYSSRYWFNIQMFLDLMDVYKCTMNNFTSYWCNRFINSNIPPKSGVFLMLFTEVSLEAYQSTRRLCGLD
jgi:hypothetical protein